MNLFLADGRSTANGRTINGDAPLLETKATLLLARTLRMRRATSAIGAALLDEAMAYLLVWPD